MYIFAILKYKLLLRIFFSLDFFLFDESNIVSYKLPYKFKYLKNNFSFSK